MRSGLEDAQRATAREVRGSNPAAPSFSLGTDEKILVFFKANQLGIYLLQHIVLCKLVFTNTCTIKLLIGLDILRDLNQLFPGQLRGTCTHFIERGCLKN